MSNRCDQCGEEKASAEADCLRCDAGDSGDARPDASDSDAIANASSANDIHQAAIVDSAMKSNTEKSNTEKSDIDHPAGETGQISAETEASSIDAEERSSAEATPVASRETPIAAEIVGEGSGGEDSIVMAEPATRDDASDVPGKRSPFATGYDLGAVNRKDEKPSLWKESFAAKGGAVGAIVLGVMAIPGAFLTTASSITACLGIAMGVWGLLSNYKRMALGGIGLCLICFAICVYRIAVV